VPQAQNLLGFRYLFAYNVFVYGIVVMFGLTTIYLFLRGGNSYKRRIKEDAYRVG
jgi:Ca2+-dependent lipid-binding protein